MGGRRRRTIPSLGGYPVLIPYQRRLRIPSAIPWNLEWTFSLGMGKFRGWPSKAEARCFPGAEGRADWAAEGLPEGSNPSGQVARRRGPYQAARAGERPGRRRCGLRVGHRPRPGGQGRVRGGWSWRVSVCNFGCEPCSGHRRLTCAIGSHWDVRECLIFGRKKDCTILASFLHYARVKLVHVTTPLGGIAHDHNTPCERLCKGNFCLGPCVHDAGRPRGKGSPLQWLMGCSRVFSLRGMNVATRRRVHHSYGWHRPALGCRAVARPWVVAGLGLRHVRSSLALAPPALGHPCVLPSATLPCEGPWPSATKNNRQGGKKSIAKGAERYM